MRHLAVVLLALSALFLIPGTGFLFWCGVAVYAPPRMATSEPSHPAYPWIFAAAAFASVLALVLISGIEGRTWGRNAASLAAGLAIFQILAGATALAWHPCLRIRGNLQRRVRLLKGFLRAV